MIDEDRQHLILFRSINYQDYSTPLLQGSAAEQACTAGKACTTNGLGAPNEDCDAGWYCPSGSYSAHKNICPKGMRFGVHTLFMLFNLIFMLSLRLGLFSCIVDTVHD